MTLCNKITNAFKVCCSSKPKEVKRTLKYVDFDGKVYALSSQQDFDRLLSAGTYFNEDRIPNSHRATGLATVDKIIEDFDTLNNGVSWVRAWITQKKTDDDATSRPELKLVLNEMSTLPITYATQDTDTKVAISAERFFDKFYPEQFFYKSGDTGIIYIDPNAVSKRELGSFVIPVAQETLFDAPRPPVCGHWGWIHAIMCVIFASIAGFMIGQNFETTFDDSEPMVLQEPAATPSSNYLGLALMLQCTLLLLAWAVEHKNARLLAWGKVLAAVTSVCFFMKLLVSNDLTGTDCAIGLGLTAAVVYALQLYTDRFAEFISNSMFPRVEDDAEDKDEKPRSEVVAAVPLALPVQQPSVESPVLLPQAPTTPVQPSPAPPQEKKEESGTSTSTAGSRRPSADDWETVSVPTMMTMTTNVVKPPLFGR